MSRTEHSREWRKIEQSWEFSFFKFSTRAARISNRIGVWVAPPPLKVYNWIEWKNLNLMAFRWRCEVQSSMGIMIFYIYLFFRIQNKISFLFFPFLIAVFRFSHPITPRRWLRPTEKLKNFLYFFLISFLKFPLLFSLHEKKWKNRLKISNLFSLSSKRLLIFFLCEVSTIKKSGTSAGDKKKCLSQENQSKWIKIRPSRPSCCLPVVHIRHTIIIFIISCVYDIEHISVIQQSTVRNFNF